jgi:hypothetical protein
MEELGNVDFSFCPCLPAPVYGRRLLIKVGLKHKKRAGGVTQAVDCLAGKCEVLRLKQYH